MKKIKIVLPLWAWEGILQSFAYATKITPPNEELDSQILLAVSTDLMTAIREAKEKGNPAIELTYSELVWRIAIEVMEVWNGADEVDATCTRRALLKDLRAQIKKLTD
ncbi:MAG: hypothetical protein WC250_02190 [Candidatus Paceibacterota bacterium]